MVVLSVACGHVQSVVGPELAGVVGAHVVPIGHVRGDCVDDSIGFPASEYPVN